MKKLIMPLLAMLAIGTAGQAQVVTNGDFATGDATGWNTNVISGAPVVEFNSTDVPTGGSGTCLEVTTADGDNAAIWQAVTLTGGNEYEIAGFSRDVASNPADGVWMEVILTETMPVNGVDVGNGAPNILLSKESTWAVDAWDGSLATPNDGGVVTYTIPGSGSQTWYLVLKTGSCCGGNGDVSFDNIDLTDNGAGVVYDSPPTPFDGSFDSAPHDLNNYGGLALPASDTAPLVNAFVDASGASGLAGDYGWNVSDGGSPTGSWQNAGLQMSTGLTIGRDLIGTWDTLEFDMKAGPGAHLEFDLRIEDMNGGAEYLNDKVTFTITESWAHYSFPLADFADGDNGDVTELDNVKQLVWEATAAKPATTEFNITLDNIEFTSSAAGVADWALFE